MKNKYAQYIIGATAGLLIGWSATESQWFYSLRKSEKITEEIEFRKSMELMKEFYDDLEDNPIKIETSCPEHRSTDYIPASRYLKDFPKKENSKTNSLEKCIFKGEETDRVV